MLEKEASGNLDGLEIGAADHFEMEAVVGVISRGMRDNRPTSPPSGKIRGVGRRGFAGYSAGCCR